jgi:fibronectin type 3 domain-containing protein
MVRTGTFLVVLAALVLVAGCGSSSSTAPSPIEAAPPTPPQIAQVVATDFGSAVVVSWAPNPETNVIGYNVYRSQDNSDTFVKINPALVTGTSYWDRTVQTGHTYTYRVTAVNTWMRESSYSPAIQIYLGTGRAPYQPATR